MMEMMRQALALGLELSALMLGAYYCHEAIAKTMGWDAGLVLVGLLMVVMTGWFIHVYLFYERKYKDS